MKSLKGNKFKMKNVKGGLPLAKATLNDWSGPKFMTASYTRPTTVVSGGLNNQWFDARETNGDPGYSNVVDQ